MKKNLIEGLGILALLVFVIVAGMYGWDQLRHKPQGRGASYVESGTINELQQLVISEQVNTFAEFVNFDNDAGPLKALRWIGLKDLGKATVLFNWRARSLYGIRISEKTPLQWRRTGQPGVIEISAPDLSVLETKVDLAKDEFTATKIERSAFVREDSKILEYLPEVQKRSDEVAGGVLANELLRATATRVVSQHVISLINQGANDAEKVHAATVTFRKA
jgi:hypothetical protein